GPMAAQQGRPAAPPRAGRQTAEEPRSIADEVSSALLRMAGVTVLRTSFVELTTRRGQQRLSTELDRHCHRALRGAPVTLQVRGRVDQLPVLVRHSLQRLLGAEALQHQTDGSFPGSARDGGSAGDDDRDDGGAGSDEDVPAAARLGALEAEEALTLVEAGEAVKAWVEAMQADAVERLHAALSEQLLDEPSLADLSRTAREREYASVRDTTCAEIEAATGQGQAVVRKQLSFATASRTRTGHARELMRQGLCSAYRAQLVEQETSDLEPDLVDDIMRDVLGCRPDGAPWSHRQFRRRLGNRKRRHCSPDDTARDREHALERRDAGADLHDDGTGELWITGEGSRVAAALDRVDALARRFRGAGDSRTLTQLRSDVALDLILHGWVPPLRVAASGREGSPAGSGRGASFRAGVSHEPPDVGEPGGCDDPMGAYRALGAPPVAHVDLVVSLTTLLGLDTGIGQLAGHGPVPAAVARDIALRLGSTWARIVTDPLTGRCLERSTSSYQFDAGMARQIRARDGTCRGPGCTVPARRCDLDHEQEWRVDASGRPVGGPTSETNGFAKHRRHHNLKTRRHWRSEPGPDGSLIWTSATGRRTDGAAGADGDARPESTHGAAEPPAVGGKPGAELDPGSGADEDDPAF
ncbi:MAG TPA: HNH endonuclease signature motif containing protein, partial [Segeticoccus sp.]|uniref:HNH endonuclease signature motif containing protein n=1 Tax=Segeticoccus sp. TaxID=2706531 RepID=UPI002D7F4104